FGIMTISKIECQDDVDILNSIGMNETLESLKGKNLMCEYVASLGGDDQNGGVKLLIAQPTDEETGTEISLVVLSEDRRKFISSVIESTRYWPVRPDIKGASGSESNYAELPKPIVSGTNWEITGPDKGRSNSYYYEKKQKAIVDGIEYPLVLSNLYSKDVDPTSEALVCSKILANTDLV